MWSERLPRKAGYDVTGKHSRLNPLWNAGPRLMTPQLALKAPVEMQQAKILAGENIDQTKWSFETHDTPPI